MVNIKEAFKCPYCGEIYDDYEDAKYCADNCIEPDDIIIREKFECEYCNEVYEYSSSAKKCEKEHVDKKDKYYEKFLEQESRNKLALAAIHKNQKKLR